MDLCVHKSIVGRPGQTVRLNPNKRLVAEIVAPSPKKLHYIHHDTKWLGIIEIIFYHSTSFFAFFAGGPDVQQRDSDRPTLQLNGRV